MQVFLKASEGKCVLAKMQESSARIIRSKSQVSFSLRGEFQGNGVPGDTQASGMYEHF